LKKIGTLKTPTINQNGYHKNILTKERIGTLFIYPTDYTPDDCLSCDGYSLLIIDYEDLYKIIGKQFNKANDPNDTFRIPDYNITGRFLQPNSSVGIQKNAGLPNITGSMYAAISGGSNIGAIFKSGSGAISTTTSSTVAGASMGASYARAVVSINASNSNSIYGNSNTVQPSSQTVHICIKYK